MSQSSTEIVIGSDEAGKGEWLGPLTVAAVALTSSQSLFLRGKGVMDSKELSLERISELTKIINANCEARHVVTISPRRFNIFLEEVRREGKSLNDVLAWGHSKAIWEVYELVKSKGYGSVRIVIDEFDRLKTERRLNPVMKLGGIVLEQRPTAEEEMPVAAASIVARDAREGWIDKESEQLNIKLRNLSPADVLRLRDPAGIAKMSFLKHK